MNRHHANSKGCQFCFRPREQRENLTEIGQEVEQCHRQMKFARQIPKSHFHASVVENVPQNNVCRIRNNIEFAEGWTVRFGDGVSTTHETMTVVINVTDGNHLITLPKYAKATIAHGGQKAGEEERIVGTVHLMRRDARGAELIATGVRHEAFGFGLGFSVQGSVLTIWWKRQFILAGTLNIIAIEASGRTGRIDELGDVEFQTGIQNIARSFHVDLVIHSRLVEGSHECGNVIDDINLFGRALKGLFDSRDARQITILPSVAMDEEIGRAHV